MVELFRETFCWLPLAHVLNSRIFVVHGGLFAKDGVMLDDLRKIDRFRCADGPLCVKMMTLVLKFFAVRYIYACRHLPCMYTCSLLNAKQHWGALLA